MGLEIARGGSAQRAPAAVRPTTAGELVDVQRRVDEQTTALTTVQTMYQNDLTAVVASRGGRPLAGRELQQWKANWTRDMNDALDGKGPHASHPTILQLRNSLGDIRFNPGLKTEANIGMHTDRSPYRSLNQTEQREMSDILRRYNTGLRDLAVSHGGLDRVPIPELDRFKQEFTDQENRRLDRAGNPNVNVRFFSGLSGSPRIGVDWGGGLWQERRLHAVPAPPPSMTPPSTMTTAPAGVDPARATPAITPPPTQAPHFLRPALSSERASPPRDRVAPMPMELAIRVPELPPIPAPFAGLKLPTTIPEPGNPNPAPGLQHKRR